jgi:hypothetical protein
MGKMRNRYKILVEKPKGKILPVRSRRRSEDNIKIVIKGTDREGVDWVDLEQDRVQCQSVMNTIMNLWGT